MDQRDSEYSKKMGPLRLKKRVKELLLSGCGEEIVEIVSDDGRVVSALMGLGYDRESLLTWKAVEVMGKVVAALPPQKRREVVQRLLWSVTEESGGIGWVAIEMMTECVIHLPQELEDLVPIIIGFYEEEIFRPSVLYSLCRLGSTRPELIRDWDVVNKIINESLRDDRPEVAGMALYAGYCLREHIGRIQVPKRLRDDQRVVKIYHNGRLQETSLSELARRAEWED